MLFATKKMNRMYKHVFNLFRLRCRLIQQTTDVAKRERSVLQVTDEPTAQEPIRMLYFSRRTAQRHLPYNIVSVPIPLF